MYNDMQHFKLRVTQSKLKKSSPCFPDLTQYIVAAFPDALVVWEHTPQLHLHAIGLCTGLELNDMTEDLSRHVTSRGFICTFYDDDSLKQRTATYYYGYLLKYWPHPDPTLSTNVVSHGSLTNEELLNYKAEYQSSKENPEQSFKSFILRNNPTSYAEVHDLCILWYRHSTSDFKYDNIKKKYCRALMYVFPDQFSEQLKSNYDHEKLIS